MKPLATIAFILVASAVVFAQAPSNSSGATDANPQDAADNRPVTGARNLGLGADVEHQNLLQTSLSVSASATNNARFASANDTWSEITSLSGSAILSRATRTASTDLSYHGTGNFYSVDTGLNTQTHQFGVAETINLKRWTVMVADRFTYEPDGSQGTPWNWNFFGNDGADLRHDYLPNGSILTPVTSRLANTSVAELQYGLSRMTSVTATASYSFLNFPDSELMDTTQRTLSGGWNHSFGRNTFGLEYSNTMFHYQKLPISMQTHDVEFSYARRMTRRYSFEAGIGPDVMVTKAAGASKTEIFGAGHLALRRQDGRTTSTLSYSRGISGGAGVTAGAKTDEVAAGVAHLFGRNLTLIGSSSYARNAATLTHTTFNTVSASGSAFRRLGRNASVSLGYYYQRQISDGVFDHLQNHTVMFTFTWAFNPVRFK